MKDILTYLSQHRFLHHDNHGVTICHVEEKEAGITLGKAILAEIINKKTMLYLSGGSLQTLYEQLAQEDLIHPGAVGLIDERYGEPMHPNSNQKMISDTGFLRILSLQNIPFYPVLQAGKEREAVAQAYDGKVRTWQAVYQRHVGLLGIGPDGHISSIIPNRPDFHNPWFAADRQHLLVSEFNDPKSKYKERVGMTFLGLSMLDILLVFVFGDAKQKTLEKVFEDGPESEIPARFFKRPEIAEKTLFITDQRV
ncbi:MAG: 6-phosphogluconolactonase [Candidatus Levyibacteriota bacterium]